LWGQPSIDLRNEDLQKMKEDQSFLYTKQFLHFILISSEAILLLTNQTKQLMEAIVGETLLSASVEVLLKKIDSAEFVSMFRSTKLLDFSLLKRLKKTC